MFYPLVQSRRTRSTLSPGGRRYAVEDGDSAAVVLRADVS